MRTIQYWVIPERERNEGTVVDYHNVFATHGFDNQFNNDFKIKLFPKIEKAIFSQNHQPPINMKIDIKIELFSLSTWSKIITLSFSNSASSFLRNGNQPVEFLS